jgi:dCTP diphosphatase
MDLVDVSKLASVLREFAEEREWKQFHTPKNLAMALGGEAGELVAVLQWLTNEQVANALSADGQVRRELTDEIADVLIYLVRLADVARIDLNEAVDSKLKRNAERYPTDEVRGSAARRP